MPLVLRAAAQEVSALLRALRQTKRARICALVASKREVWRRECPLCNVPKLSHRVPFGPVLPRR